MLQCARSLQLGSPSWLFVATATVLLQRDFKNLTPFSQQIVCIERQKKVVEKHLPLHCARLACYDAGHCFRRATDVVVTGATGRSKRGAYSDDRY